MSYEEVKNIVGKVETITVKQYDELKVDKVKVINSYVKNNDFFVETEKQTIEISTWLEDCFPLYDEFSGEAINNYCAKILFNHNELTVISYEMDVFFWDKDDKFDMWSMDNLD